MDVDGDGSQRDTRSGAVGDSDNSFAAGRTTDESRGSAGFGDFLRAGRDGGTPEEEKRGAEEGEGEEEEESDDDEEMFELEMSVVVEAVEGRLRTGAETRA